ncbi:hypothetical protein CVT24_010711 [Panaeolus cyanescens]|uniref:Uncharacterized protein n=1 Tax=Panaeolus cyanescens TaxID=181874 RepID=A0A409YM53_9AGAR|nr:hypothetical protein CVT24_010711 [Panaeolus cyanescens]
MTVFYAYIHNINDDNTTRVLMVFANRETADEWWRAILTIPNVASAYQRISPQFYVHDTRCNVLEFFTNDRFRPISEAFRGRLFLTLLHDRGGREFPIIPPLSITDHVSGNWFFIRSVSKPSLYWHYASGGIVASDTKRTQFQIKGRTLQDGTIMIKDDLITLTVAERRNVDVNRSGNLVVPGVAREFRFGDFARGAFAVDAGDDAIAYDPVSLRNMRWELVD